MTNKSFATWMGLSAVGIVLGFAMALFLSGIFAWLTPEAPDAPVKIQLVMWLIAPLWLSIWSAVYVFESVPKALKLYLPASLVLLAMLTLTRVVG